jgi:predicted DNA-binding protein (MmcQ/YjbR family)
VAARKGLARAEAALRKHALNYPETHEDFPWGHRALKVKGKAFLFMALGIKEEDLFSLSVKLPVSGKLALSLPFASPTEYGLGKSGWVTARFHSGDDIPIDMLKEWVDESYRAVAPKRVLARLEDASE